MQFICCHMTKQSKIISSGPLKGKKLIFAGADRVSEYKPIADEFILRLFDWLPGEYAISDESELGDFVEFGSNGDTSREWEQIEEHYGLTKVAVGTENLADIFAAIALRRNIQ